MGEPEPRPTVVVIGAGVIGLAAAVALQEAGGHSVVVVAERRPEATTSIGAGAQWLPYALNQTDPAKIRQWSGETLVMLMGLIRSGRGGEAGVFLNSGYFLDREHENIPDWADQVLGFRTVSRPELQAVGGATWARANTAFAFTTPFMSPPLYLRWLEARLVRAGGRLRAGCRVESIQSVAEGRFTAAVPVAVINCSGNGAKELCGDDAMVPARGQLLRFEPGCCHLFVDAMGVVDRGRMTYVFPRDDCTVVGGTFEPGETETSVTTTAQQQIREDAEAMVPALKGKRLLSTWAGLRPTRKAIRLEADAPVWSARGAHQVLVLHNYGHGGGGFSLHWGCALEVLRILRRHRRPTSSL